MVIKFTVERETKNAVRFQEVPDKGKPPAIGTLYIQKWVFGGNPPETVEIDLILPNEL